MSNKNGHFGPKKTSNLTTFETQYLSEVKYFLFLLFEMDILSYLPPFYHNFENLILYGIYKFLSPFPKVSFDSNEFLLLKSYFYNHNPWKKTSGAKKIQKLIKSLFPNMYAKRGSSLNIIREWLGPYVCQTGKLLVSSHKFLLYFSTILLTIEGES